MTSRKAPHLRPHHGAAPPARPSLTELSRRPGAPLRLYCLPPAGAGAGFYLPWAQLLPETLELYAVQLPGRENAADQLSLTDPQQVSAGIADLLDAADDARPFALFGHSIGALLAYETTRRIRRTRRRMPVLLALSALPAPHLGPVAGEITQRLIDGGDGRLNLVDLIGHLPGPVLKDASLLSRVCIPLLADLLLGFHHRYLDEAPLDVPFALYGGDNDPLTTVEQLHAWNDLTTQPAPSRLFPGGHLYPAHQTAALTEQLVKDLAAATRYTASP